MSVKWKPFYHMVYLCETSDIANVSSVHSNLHYDGWLQAFWS